MKEAQVLQVAEYFKYTSYLKQKYLCVCPYDEKSLRKLLMETIGVVIGLSVGAIFILILWNGVFADSSPGYFLCSIIFAVYLIAIEVPNYKVRGRENIVYRELIVYLSRVKHHYLSCHHIPNSVLEASGEMGYEVQRLAEEVYRILMEGDRKERVREYVQYNKANRYMKLFLVQAYEASEKGDVFLADGCSLFSENTEHLRMEIMEELYRRRKRSHEFAGYTFVSITPVFMMPLLKQWGLDFVPELDFFYAGTGQLLELVTFGAAFIVYGFINQAKEIELFLESAEHFSGIQEWFRRIPFVERMEQRFERLDNKMAMKIRELLLQSRERISFGMLLVKMLIYMMGILLFLLMFVVTIHFVEKRTVLEQVSAIEAIAPLASKQKQQELSEDILILVKRFRKQQEVTVEVLTVAVRNEIKVSNNAMEKAIVEEIQKKLEQYHSAGVTVTEVLLCVGCSFFFGLLPLLKLYYQVRRSMDGALYEIRQFQSVILMERQLQGVTITGLLEDMEAFAGVFKAVLRKCINSYSSGPETALRRMKVEGGKLHIAFGELADAFLSVDEVGIRLAFAEVEHNRSLMDKMAQLESEIDMENKKDGTDLLSKLPMVLAVGAYFILPFFVHSLQGVTEVFELLEELQM